MKILFGLLSLALLLGGLLAMSVTILQIPVGPMPAIEHDLLNFKEAFWSRETDSLILVRDNMWTKIDLRAASLAGKQFKYDILPTHENSFTIADFHVGAPELKALAGSIEVPVLTQDTQQGASFGYKWNGEPWHDHMRKVSPPAPLKVGLYRGHGHLAEDNRTFWGSYLFAVPESREDGRHGIEFFYYPGTKAQISWHSPRLFPYGPSLLAVCLLIYCFPLRLGGVGVTVLGFVTIGLHLFSSLTWFILVSSVSGWGGQGAERGASPLATAILGLIIICPTLLGMYQMRPQDTKNAQPVANADPLSQQEPPKQNG